MTRVTLEQKDLTLKEIARLVREGPILVTEQGQPIMAVVPLSEEEAEAWAMGQSEELLALINESRQSLRTEGGLSLDEIRKDLGLS